MPAGRPHKKQKPAQPAEQPEDLAGVGPESTEGPGSMPQAVLTVRGGVDALKRHVLHDDPVAPPAEPTEEAPAEDQDDSRGDVREALKNPNYIVRARRIRPRRFADCDANVDVYEEICPIDLASVEEEIKLHGGRRYVIKVIDPESNRAVASCFYEVQGDPVLAAPQGASGAGGPSGSSDDDGNGSGAVPPTTEERLAQSLEEQNLITAQEIALEQNKARLEDIRNRHKSGDPESDRKIREMERRFAMQEQALQIAKIQADNDKKLAEMERRFAEKAAQPTYDPMATFAPILQQVLAKPAPDPTAAIAPLLQIFMKKMDQDSQQFQMLMSQMRDDKLSGLQKSLEDLKRSPAKQNTESMSDVFENILRLRQISAKLSDPDAEDDDDPVDIEESSPWFALAKEYAPKFFQMIEAMAGNKSGPQLTREEVERKFAEAANVAAAQTIQQLRTAPGLPAPAPVNPVAPQPLAAQPIRALPAPAPVAAAPPPAPVPPRQAPVILAPAAAPPPAGVVPVASAVPGPVPISVIAHPVGPTPSAPPAASYVNPTQPAAPATPQTPQILSEEEAIRQVVAPVLVALANEMSLRPMEYVWNAFVWRTLPQDMIQAIAAAPTAVEMIHVFDGHASPEGIAQLVARAGDPRVAGWVQRGHQELKGWWEQFCKDPRFDPFADSDEEGEGEAL